MYSTIKVWIDLSKSDLNSSKILHENGHYRNSYFLFQQTTEKANKAFALISEILTETELKTIQHDQTKIYRKAIVKQEKNILESIELFKQIEIHKNLELLSPKQLKIRHDSIKKSISFIDSLRNCDLINITSEDLDYYINEINELKNFKLELPKDFNSILRTQMIALSNWIGQFDTEKAKTFKKEIQDFLNIEESEKLFESLKTVIYPMFDIMFINFTLYICAILTIQHSSLTRYPSDGINPERIYNRKLPIVNKQMEFIELLTEAISRMEKNK